MGLPWWLSGKESACNAEDLCLIPRSGRSPEGGHGNPLQYSCLKNPMDRGTWQAAVHRVAQSQTRLKWPSGSGSSRGVVKKWVMTAKEHVAFLGGGVIKMFQIWLSWWWHNFPYTLKLIELYAYNWYIFFMYELYLNKLLTGKNQVTTCHHLCPTFLLNKELSYMVHGFLPFPFIFNSTVLWLLMNINIVTHTVFLIAKDF